MRLILILALALAIAVTPLESRLPAAIAQCWGFTYTASCLMNDVLTGEDL